MKKIIATILIMIFATNMSALANGVLTIDKDGNVKYEEVAQTNSDLSEVQNVTTPVFKEIKVDNANTNANLQPQQQETKINVKNIDMNDETLKKYHEKFYKYSSRDYSYAYKDNMDKYLKGYKHYNYPEKDNFDKNDRNIMRFELQDGDYAILDNSVKGNKKYKYAAEYHKEGSLFGVVQIKTIRKTRKSATIAFYEYRQNEEDISKFNIKHTMFLDIEKEKDKVNIAQFVYKDKISFENLVCAQINNDLYLNEKSKNIIVKMKKFDIPAEDNVVVKENAQYTLQFTAIAPFFAIGAAVIAPFLPIFFVGLMLSIPSTL